MHFPYIDADKDGKIVRTEWETMSDIFSKSENALLALKPGPSPKSPPTLSWKQNRGLPYVPSPLAYQGHVYLIKNGGMISCMNATTGNVIYRREEHLARHVVQEMRGLEAVHHGAFDFGHVQFDAHIFEAGIDGL